MKRDNASATDPCHDFADGTRERRSDPAPNFSNVPGIAFVDHTGPLKLRGCWIASLRYFVQYIEVLYIAQLASLPAWICGRCSPPICDDCAMQRASRRMSLPMRRK